MSGGRTGRSQRLISDAADVIRELSRGPRLSELAERVVSGSLAGPSSAAAEAVSAGHKVRALAEASARGSNHVSSGIGKAPGRISISTGLASEAVPANSVRRVGEVLRKCQRHDRHVPGLLLLGGGPKGLGGSMAVRQLLQQVRALMSVGCRLWSSYGRWRGLC